MDINALNELIARARETVASVVQADQRVAACTAELAAQPEIKVAPARAIGSIPKRVSGWVPTTEKLPTAARRVRQEARRPQRAVRQARCRGCGIRRANEARHGRAPGAV